MSLSSLNSGKTGFPVFGIVIYVFLAICGIQSIDITEIVVAGCFRYYACPTLILCVDVFSSDF